MTALDRALALIAQEFGPDLAHDMLKRRVRAFLRAGTGHPAVRARYGARARALHEARLTLGEAIRAVEGWYADERAALNLAVRCGAPYSRLSMEVLRELRLILRLARRQRARHRLYRGVLSLLAS